VVEFCVSDLRKKKGLELKEQICRAIILDASPEKENAGKKRF
jgi:hypothetical protein